MIVVSLSRLEGPAMDSFLCSKRGIHLVFGQDARIGGMVAIVEHFQNVGIIWQSMQCSIPCHCSLSLLLGCCNGCFDEKCLVGSATDTLSMLHFFLCHIKYRLPNSFNSFFPIIPLMTWKCKGSVLCHICSNGMVVSLLIAREKSSASNGLRILCRQSEFSRFD